MYCSCTCGSLTAKTTELLSIVTVLAPSACPGAFLACKDSGKEGGGEEVSHDAGGVQNAVRRRTEELHVIVFDVDNVFYISFFEGSLRAHLSSFDRSIEKLHSSKDPMSSLSFPADNTGIHV